MNSVSTATNPAPRRPSQNRAKERVSAIVSIAKAIPRLGRCRNRLVLPYSGRDAGEPAEARFVFEPLQARMERGTTGVAEGTAGEAPEFVGELAVFEHAVCFVALEPAPVGEGDGDRASLPAKSAACRFRHQLDMPGQCPDLAIGERRLVPGFGVARLAAERQCHGERDAV